MNKPHTLFHLREALEELIRTANELERDQEYEEDEFRVAMEHLYHHLNTAWNAKNASTASTTECSESNFKLWRQFPKDISFE